MFPAAVKNGDHPISHLIFSVSIHHSSLSTLYAPTAFFAKVRLQIQASNAEQQLIFLISQIIYVAR